MGLFIDQPIFDLQKILVLVSKPISVNLTKFAHTFSRGKKVDIWRNITRHNQMIAPRDS